MHRIHCGIACLLLVSVLLLTGCAQTAPLGKDTHIVFLIGADEYSPEVSMPDLAQEMRSRFGTTCTLLHDKNMKSIWKSKPNQRLNDFPKLEALAGADLVVFFLRFRTLPKEQLDLIQAYLDRGRPVVGFRTSTHAFNYGKGEPLRAKWNAFGANVLGAPWIHHYGHSSSTDVSIVPGAADHPILKGVAPKFHVRSWTYHVLPDYPPATATKLLLGKSVGKGRGEVAKRPVNPIAWTHTHPGGGRVFMTTMGHPEDFKVESFRRLAINGILWALGQPVPDTLPPANDDGS